MQRIVSQVVFKPNPGADMMKLMAMQTSLPNNEFTAKIAQEIKDITE